MTIDGKTQVQEEASDNGVENSTSVAGGVADATSTTPPVDAEELQVENEELQARLQQYQQDINGVKSSLQKQIAQQQKEWARKEKEFNEKLAEARMAGMDEDARKEYEKQLLADKLHGVESKEQEIERLQGEYQATIDAVGYFLQQGVPYDALALNEGYNALYQSGMAWIMDEFARLKLAAQNGTQTTKKAPPKEAPLVVTENAAPPYSGTTWKELEAKLGKSEDEIWRMVEMGTLSSEVIPGVKNANKG